MSDNERDAALLSVNERIDQLFRTLNASERLILLQRETLANVSSLAEQLKSELAGGHIPEDLIEDICRGSMIHLLSSRTQKLLRPLEDNGSIMFVKKQDRNIPGNLLLIVMPILSFSALSAPPRRVGACRCVARRPFADIGVDALSASC